MKPHETPAAASIARATPVSAKSPSNGLQKIRRFQKPQTQLPNVARHWKPSVSATVAPTQRSHQASKTASGSLEKHKPASANPHLRHCPGVSPATCVLQNRLNYEYPCGVLDSTESPYQRPESLKRPGPSGHSLHQKKYPHMVLPNWFSPNGSPQKALHKTVSTKVNLQNVCFTVLHSFDAPLRCKSRLPGLLEAGELPGPSMASWNITDAASCEEPCLPIRPLCYG